MTIETPPYVVLEKSGSIELREYRGYITASVEVRATNYTAAANKAFRVLADYIFGNNTKKAAIAMTAPVTTQQPATSEKISMTAPVIAAKMSSQTYVISFTMPSRYSMDDVPTPNNKAVIIRYSPPHHAAVIRFSGYTTEAKIQKKAKELAAWAAQNDVTLTGELLLSRYNPPWIPGFIRRNEIAFVVT